MAHLTKLIRRLDATGVPVLLARLGVGGMFAYLALMKLLDPVEFLKQIHAYRILPTNPPQLLNLTAVALPWLELVCALALIAGVARRGAALVITGMLLFFTPMLFLRAWGMYRDVANPVASFCGIRFDCGCGTGEVYICWKLAENLALQAGALIALFSASSRFSLGALLARGQAQAPTGRRPPQAVPGPLGD